jgi:hypothetical protein
MGLEVGAATRCSNCLYNRQQLLSNSLPWLQAITLLLALSVEACFAEETSADAKKSPPEAVLVRTIAFNGFIANEVYPLDLDGDGKLELLCLQSPGIYQSEVFADTRFATPEEQRNIYCLTAIDSDGKQLWQYGKPNLQHRAAASHVADQMLWPCPTGKKGQLELAVLDKKKLLMLDPKTGTVNRSTELRADNYCIVIGVRSSKGYRLLVQNTEKGYAPYEYGLPALLYDAANMRLLRVIDNVQGSGHSPRAVDLDGDGDDELLIGYDAYDSEGELLWRLSDLGKINPVANHVDQLQAAHFGDPSKPAVIYAGSYYAIMGTSDGKLLWKKGFGHPQHVVTGNFRAGDKQACIAIYGCRDLLGEAQQAYLKSAGLRTPPKGNRNNIAFLNAAGEIVGLLFPPSLAYHSGEGILLYPQGCEDGSDAIITRDWPWPEAYSMSGEREFVFRRPESKESENKDSPAGPGPDGYGVRIADFDRDGRAEVIIHDQTAGWLYQPPFLKRHTSSTHHRLLPITGQGNYGLKW